MKRIDRLLQAWRIRLATGQLRKCRKVVDIGAHEGELLEKLGAGLTEGFGIEPLATEKISTARYTIWPGFFPEQKPERNDWDAVTILAVLEHIPSAQQTELARAIYEILGDGGRVIVTVPARTVDFILAILRFLKLIDGMSLEEHYGFCPMDTLKVFAAPHFRPVSHRRFQLGLNHLFVFEKTAAATGLNRSSPAPQS